MDQGRNRRRTFHRVGEPGGERKLGRFADTAAKEAKTGQRRQRPVGNKQVREFGQVGGSRLKKQQKNTEEKTRIADAVHDKRLFGRGSRSRFLKPETDEQIRRQADQLPEGIQNDQITRQHNAEHGTDEETQKPEIPVAVLFVVQIGNGIKLHQQGDEMHDDQHQQGERIEPESDGNRPTRNQEPVCAEGQHIGAGLGGHEDRQTQSGQCQSCGCTPGPKIDSPTRQQAQGAAQKGQNDEKPEKCMDGIFVEHRAR